MFSFLICNLCGIYMQGMIIIMPFPPDPLPTPPPEEARIELIVNEEIT